MEQRSPRAGSRTSTRNGTSEVPIFFWRRNLISGGHRKKLPCAPLAKSSVTLSQRFFEQLIEAPVPLDLRAIKALKRSPLSLDLYAWATRRVSYLKRPLRISWRSFQNSFGVGYAETPQGKSRFRGNAIEALQRVKAVYPQLKIELKLDGLVLFPSLTHIPKHSLG